jgi:cobalamin biosynthesis protein CbiG
MLWLGIGCQRGASDKAIESAIDQTLAIKDLQITDVLGVASIDHKAQEPGILAVCTKYRWPLQTYSTTELAEVATEQPAAIVLRLIGTNSVAEAAAILAGSQELLVVKQIYQIEGKFITVAIGQIKRPSQSEFLPLDA